MTLPGICDFYAVDRYAVKCAHIVPVTARRFAFMIDNTPAFALNVMRMLSARLERAHLRGA